MASIWKRARDRLDPDAPWLITLYESGKRRTVTGAPNHKDTQAIARRLESQAALRERGVLDPAQERMGVEAKRPISQHIDEYEEHLADKGCGHPHIECWRRRSVPPRLWRCG